MKILFCSFARSGEARCGCGVHRFEFRDKTFFLAHIVISVLLGVFVGGLYFQTGNSIAGFQSRVGVLFFLVRLRTCVVQIGRLADFGDNVLEQGSLIALSSLSALHNVLATRPLFVRERSNAYYRFGFLQLLCSFVRDDTSDALFPCVVRPLGYSSVSSSISSRYA